MRRALRWTCFVALASAMAAGCAGGGSLTLDAGTDGTAGADGSGSGGGMDAHVDSSGEYDSSMGADSTADTGSSSGSPGDSPFDITAPDSFFGPDAQESGSAEDAGQEAAGEAGCLANGVTCQGNVSYDCSAGVLTTTNCAQLVPAEICANGFGCVACQPGAGTCSGNTGTACNSTGTGTTTNVCDPQLGETCNAATGQCNGDCASVGSSYIGCEYYALSMTNSQLDQTNFDFSVSISNTATTSATILITGPNAFSQTYTLAGGAIQNYVLPWYYTISQENITEQVAGAAYHIKSSEPVTVYQYNAYEYEVNKACASDPFPSPPCRSYTNDASLLIPVNALTGNYYVVAGADWHSWGAGATGGTCTIAEGSLQLPGIVDIVATQANTSVTISTTGQIMTMTGLGANGGTVTLNQGDVLQVSTAENASAQCTYGSDLSGSLITASAPVLVLGGADCSFTPANVAACDHLEQINFPLETLRSDYLVTLPFNNNGTPRQFVKIVGTAGGTTLATNPTQAAVPATISAGQVVWFETTQDFHLTSSQPVAVGQFMEGQFAIAGLCTEPNLEAPGDCGDPSMSMAVGTSQFRDGYQFIAPPSYFENWLNVIAPAGATVTVDGTAVTGFNAIGTSGFSVAHVSLCANGGTCSGVHNASSSQPFGIQVYGYGYFTSYMYPGGLNLTRQ